MNGMKGGFRCREGPVWWFVRISCIGDLKNLLKKPWTITAVNGRKIKRFLPISVLSQQKSIHTDRKICNCIFVVWYFDDRASQFHRSDATSTITVICCGINWNMNRPGYSFYLLSSRRYPRSMAVFAFPSPRSVVVVLCVYLCIALAQKNAKFLYKRGIYVIDWLIDLICCSDWLIDWFVHSIDWLIDCFMLMKCGLVQLFFLSACRVVFQKCN